MSTEIKGITFFTDNLVDTSSHACNTFNVNPTYKELFFDNNVYTMSSAQGKFRLSNNHPLKVANYAQIEQYAIFFVGNVFHTMGAFSSTNSQLPVNTIVGRYSSIAAQVRRMAGNHPMERFTTSMLTYSKNTCAFNDYLDAVGVEFDHRPSTVGGMEPIVIGNDVWIGQDVLFSSKGIAVGDGAIVAAGSVVTKNVPPYAIVGGNPSKVIRYRFEAHIIERLLKLKWWQYGFADFKGVTADDSIEVFLEKVEKLVSTNQIQPFRPTTISVKDFLDIEKSSEE
ncbi:CatB-related O-acetyltransferase [Staphylococcus saprophyticus]|nr:CatB-related O-acetyltransferase [Staphylococcus saprophyticus]